MERAFERRTRRLAQRLKLAESGSQKDVHPSCALSPSRTSLVDPERTLRLARNFWRLFEIQRPFVHSRVGIEAALAFREPSGSMRTKSCHNSRAQTLTLNGVLFLDL
jgi:hypothetical protein